MSDQPLEQGSLSQKLESLLADHRRFMSEFEVSLRNAGNFIQIADEAMEREPEATVEMLNQIRDFDLLGHVRNLIAEFNAVQGFVIASPLANEEERFRPQIEGLAADYEDLEQRAEDQLNTISSILDTLDS